MSIIVTALALVSSAQAAPSATPPMDHAQHQQMVEKHDTKDCACCKDMAGKDGKMACCDKNEKSEGEHAGHAGH